MILGYDQSLLRGNAERAWLALALLVLAAGVLRQIDLPGLYMDAINPEYLVVHTLRPALHNPVWIFPGKVFPILGNLYHGVQNYYLGLPFFALFGTTLTAVRVFHGLFGAAVVVLVHRLLTRTRIPSWVGGLATVALAADPAFIASLRTQYTIILGGMVWALLSLELLFRHRAACDAGRTPRWPLLLSGVCFGLAVYGYFVLGFLGPALVALVIIHRGRLRTGQTLGRWCGGMLLGLLPYGAGYFSWWLAVGGSRAFVLSVADTVDGLQIFLSQGVLERIGRVVHLADLAWTNHGSELLMFGHAHTSPFAYAKLALLGAVIVLGIAAAAFRRREALAWALVAPALLASYCAAAVLFAPRLWAHHFGAVLPLFYLGMGASIGGLGAWLAPRAGVQRAARAAVTMALVVVIALSLAHQQAFFSRLAKVGGTGFYTDATSLLASRALRDREPAVYVFPEWGFFMPFSFLTGNLVPYALECGAPRVREALQAGHRVVVASWKPELLDGYQSELERLGAMRFERETVARRDSAPAFYLIRALLR